MTTFPRPVADRFAATIAGAQRRINGLEQQAAQTQSRLAAATSYPTGWLPLTLVGGWANTGGAETAAQWRMDTATDIHLIGSISDGTVTDGTACITLPNALTVSSRLSYVVWATPASSTVIPRLTTSTGTGDVLMYGVAAASAIIFDFVVHLGT